MNIPTRNAIDDCQHVNVRPLASVHYTFLVLYATIVNDLVLEMEPIIRGTDYLS